MADSKITALTALTAADPVNDMFPVVDVSDTTMAASGTTKKISVNNILSSSPTASGALTVTGLVTAGSAAITGDLTVRTNKLAVTSTGVGCGTATPGTSLEVWKDFIRVQSDVTSGIYGTQFWRSGAERGRYSFDFSASLLELQADGEIRFLTGGENERLRIDSSGNVNIVTGNVVIATSGKGIDFSAVTGGTGTATGNVLNDYEEGTFTPTVIGTTTAGVGVYTSQTGRYTKVGRLVTVEIDLGWSAHTGTGNMQFAGLPFTINGSVNSSVTFGYVNNIALTAGNIMIGYTDLNSTLINLHQTPTGGGAATAVPIDAAGRVICSLNYTV